MTPFLEDPENSSSISGNEINKVFQDDSGIIWIGTRGGGLNKISAKSIPFENYSAKDGLREEVTLAFYEDKSERLWVGTFGGGVHIFERKNDRYVLDDIINQAAYGLSGDYITSFTEDAVGKIWVGTRRGGISIVDPDNFKIKALINDSENSLSLSNNFVLSQFAANDESIWVGTNGGGLNRVNSVSHTADQFLHAEADSSSLSSNAVTALFEDSHKKVWVGTNAGLNLFNPEKSDFSRFLDSLAVMCIYEGSHNKLWIGTENSGLILFDVASNTTTSFSINDGLSYNTVYGILEDDQGYLWLNNAGSITRFDPLTRQMRIYDKSDGIQNIDFNQLAYHQGKYSRRLFLGNVEGFVSFKPNAKRNDFLPNIAFTSFHIFDKEHPFDGRQISLKPDENVFSVNFAALDFTQPEKNQYLYQLAGFNDTWLTHAWNQGATYTNLDPGHYTLNVKGSNNDGVWNEKAASLDVFVKPHYYQTWWFRLSALLAAISSVIFIFWKRRQQQKELETAREAERESLALAIHDGPLQTLIGTRFITHVLKNGIPSEDLQNQVMQLENTLQQVRHELRTVEEEIEPNLSDGLAQAIEKHVSLLQLAHPSYQINTSLSVEPYEITMSLRKDMYRIYRTVILNVFKYTKEANIDISLDRKGKVIKLEIKDDGPGFDVPNELPKGHALYFSDKLAKALGGSFNIISKENQGTHITVSVQEKGWI